jgi:hypothetical protein
VSELEYAEGWKPDVGDLVLGKVTDVAMGWSDYRGQYPIITIADEKTQQPVAVHGFHAGLFNQLMTLQPRVGERIAVKFVEKRPHRSKPGQTVSVYRVKIQGRTGTDVWNQLATTQQPPQPQPQPQPTQETFPSADDADDDMPF